jgi:uncharacterized membrane protein YqgA involved in biofilm formation
MTRILNTMAAVAGGAIAGLTALPLDDAARAYIIFTLGLVVLAVNAWMVPSPPK